jgi:hypothetical protein
MQLGQGHLITRVVLRGVCIGLSIVPIATLCGAAPVSNIPSVVVTPAPAISFPGGKFYLSWADTQTTAVADCNSPLEWIDGTLYVFNSLERVWRGQGPDLEHLTRGNSAYIDPTLADLRLWMEGTHRDAKGVLYGYVHNEYPNVCPDRVRTLPSGHPLLARIGALRSTDNGKSWKNQGWLMDGRPKALKCDTEGTYYVGGVGDFVAFVDNERQYIYFFFASYAREFAEQGLGVARLAYADRDRPIGKLTVWNGHAWEPSPDGELRHIKPMLPAAADIHTKEGKIFWGPSVHWNTYLKKYVMVVNQTRNAAWDTDGQYVLFTDTLSDPRAWSKPVKFLDWNELQKSHPPDVKYGWYVQMAGTGPGESDKLASQTARLFLEGRSQWQIRFRKPGEN